GTAETGREGISHSWFAGFVEINRHKLVAVVFLEEWRGNQATASRIFGQIMTQIAQLYLENE
ncbi:MAG: penicillin-binding protein 2, partial [Firmicutes bacterium]|nr:penicillin-binding protein 2 [Bacillota bacterium]